MTLPNGWAWAMISDLVGRDGAFVDGDWVESKDQDPNGDVRLIQLADVGDGFYRDRSDRYLTSAKAAELGCTFLTTGDVLIARMPDPLGRACIFPGDFKPCVTVVDVCIVRSGLQGIDHRWLMFTVNAPAFRTAIASLQSGSTRKRISRSNLAKLELPVPPLAEQHRIVAEIEKQFTRLDASMAALRRVQANLKRYKASVLKAACEGRLARSAQDLNDEPASVLLERILAERRRKWEADLRAKGKELSKVKYVEPTSPDTEGLPELPEGWCWATVEQVAEHRLGKMLDKEKNKGVLRPYLRNLNVRWFGFDLSDVQYMRVIDDELESVSVHAGDLVVCEGGEPGRAAVWSASEPFVIQKALHRVSLKNDVSPKYLSYSLAVDASNGSLERYFTGSTIKHFTGQSLRSYVFALPPLAEQRRIVEKVERRLSVVQEVETVVAANLARAERLRQSILKQAFEGKLAPQDPNDEPAGVLLELIRAKRETSSLEPLKRNQHRRKRR